LTELLAKNAHENWARQRMEEGWRWGPRRDDEHKLHPSLVPYEQLSESEKEYDRKTAMETIAKRLSDERLGERDPHRIFGYLYLAEFILASDTHEWMRLMREAEWYGA
jgi:hypothetical protein